ncbi:MAG: hypothetical protein JWR19_127 [Pedosphaera sp.]|nr:hypothetical protein [Pedosphaera sp.]
MGRKTIKKKENNMNDNNYRTLRTRFAPDTRFRVKAVPYRATETTALEQLKQRLLLQLLGQTMDPEQNALLRRAANDAAALAWATYCPLLLFPALLEEKAQVALLQDQHQQEVRQRSQNLALEAA